MMNHHSVCIKYPVFAKRSSYGVRHDRRGKRGGGTAEEQSLWPVRRKRNGDKGGRREQRGIEIGKPKNQSGAEHSLAEPFPKRGGHRNRNQDGTGER